MRLLSSETKNGLRRGRKGPAEHHGWDYTVWVKFVPEREQKGDSTLRLPQVPGQAKIVSGGIC